ncbi:hypothetical protein [Clostridium oryzae]|uniref:Integrase catalytic domain-containing protein n=1 Tax=Clostridium oryzae TaxID=1450648 RepID=A0A1V4I406_9CLOT|nr:hypothetical protein [Clostridium oryzae]OPJ54600.1 hypothetical protein CLORY_45490 [Clostridium oryzae]
MGRTYVDFNLFLVENSDTSVGEMDTVHGTRNGKVLLTFFFCKCSLMLAFIIDSCTQLDVKKIIDELYESFGEEVFKESFLVILTDNG